jgi:hypothetical protein
MFTQRTGRLERFCKNDYLNNHFKHHSYKLNLQMQSSVSGNPPPGASLMISGKDFNDKLANDSTFPFYKKELVKLTVENNIHNSFEFKLGLNVDPVPFNASGNCKKGGFYFTFSHCWSEWVSYRKEEFMYWMWDVKIPDDAQVYLESNTKIKADKFILENKRCIYDDKERCMLAVKHDGYAIKFIKDPSEEMKLEAVRRNGRSIEFIKDPSERVQLEAVRKNGSAIEFIKDPSEKVQLEAVRQDGCAIEYINDPSDTVQLEAVRQDGYAIKFIKDPSEEMNLEASKQNGYAIQFIKDPSETVQLEAVRQNGWVIRYIENSSERVQLEAVRQCGSAIEYIKDPSEKVQLEAVRENKYTIGYIKNPSETVQLEARKSF